MFGAARKRELLLQARIKELENILCPAEQHDYHEVDKTRHIVDSYGTEIFTKKFICRRCYKRVEKESWM